MDRSSAATTSVVYDGSFALGWLADDEEICSAGDDSGARDRL